MSVASLGDAYRCTRLSWCCSGVAMQSSIVRDRWHGIVSSIHPVCRWAEPTTLGAYHPWVLWWGAPLPPISPPRALLESPACMVVPPHARGPVMVPPPSPAAVCRTRTQRCKGDAVLQGVPCRGRHGAQGPCAGGGTRGRPKRPRRVSSEGLACVLHPPQQSIGNGGAAGGVGEGCCRVHAAVCRHAALRT